MSNSDDLLHRFIFDNTDIRGEIVSLNQTLSTLFERQNYSLPVRQLLGEFIAAAALLSSTLKFDGILTLQARGAGKIPLIMAEASYNKQLRGIVKLNSDDVIDDVTNLPALIGDGILSITIDPEKGERYQGIVPLDGPCLSDCLEHYFVQSVQLPSRIWLASDGNTACGVLLQRLPQQLADQATNDAAWETKVQLANTITLDELIKTSHETMLNRLFHEDGVRYFEPAKMEFSCSCSRIRSDRVIRQLGQEEVEEILQEQGLISIDCQFCGFQYHYQRADIEALFSPKTRH